MRIVSLLPDATEILLALGLEDELVGVTHRCDVPAIAGEPAVLTRPGSAGGDALDAAGLVDVDPELVIVGAGAGWRRERPPRRGGVCRHGGMHRA